MDNQFVTEQDMERFRRLESITGISVEKQIEKYTKAMQAKANKELFDDLSKNNTCK